MDGSNTWLSHGRPGFVSHMKLSYLNPNHYFFLFFSHSYIWDDYHRKCETTVGGTSCIWIFCIPISWTIACIHPCTSNGCLITGSSHFWLSDCSIQTLSCFLLLHVSAKESFVNNLRISTKTSCDYYIPQVLVAHFFTHKYTQSQLTLHVSGTPKLFLTFTAYGGKFWVIPDSCSYSALFNLPSSCFVGQGLKK